MRTTVTFDPDVYIRLQEVARERGQSIRVVLNDALRKGLLPVQAGKRKPVTLRVFPMGLRVGLSYDNIGELLERSDGPLERCQSAPVCARFKLQAT